MGTIPSRNNKKFEVGDTIYFIGDQIGINCMMDKDVPYKVVSSYPPADALYDIWVVGGRLSINNNGYARESKYFISEEEYKKRKEINDKKTLTNDEILNKMIKDTENDTLFWVKPYSDKKNYYRTHIKVNNPVNSSLRIDVKMTTLKTKDEYAVILWVANIYFHRKKMGEDQEPVLVREIKETVKINDLVKKIKIQLIEREARKDDNDIEEEDDVYEQYDFEDLSEEEIFGKEEIKVGDKVRLVNREDALFRYSKDAFEKTNMRRGGIFTVANIMTIRVNNEDVKCIAVSEPGWSANIYKLDNFEKV